MRHLRRIADGAVEGSAVPWEACGRTGRSTQEREREREGGQRKGDAPMLFRYRSAPATTLSGGGERHLAKRPWRRKIGCRTIRVITRSQRYEDTLLPHLHVPQRLVGPRHEGQSLPPQRSEQHRRAFILLQIIAMIAMIAMIGSHTHDPKKCIPAISGKDFSASDGKRSLGLCGLCDHAAACTDSCSPTQCSAAPSAAPRSSSPST